MVKARYYTRILDAKKLNKMGYSANDIRLVGKELKICNNIEQYYDMLTYVSKCNDYKLAYHMTLEQFVHWFNDSFVTVCCDDTDFMALDKYSNN